MGRPTRQGMVEQTELSNSQTTRWPTWSWTWVSNWIGRSSIGPPSPGRFDFLLHWSPNELTADAPDAPPGMLTALQEQLGLKLESVKAPVDVLVIDHIGSPSQN